LFVSLIGLALGLAGPAEAAKKKSGAAAHSVKQRHSAVAVRRDHSGVPRGPLYNGQDYIGNDPDPNIRSYLIRDMSRYGGVD
jgi:hypothetical protein